ncbi:MAG: pitrilysin family protein [Candidatus Promineifilaceae bacterium]|nr:pitrilysin family protein [Candidatus Promineifilaceae bacterium]
MTQAVRRTSLENGLTVVLKEMHHAPVTSFWVWYRVGSRNETPGLTGASHWVEHMMFKGSPAFPPGTLDRAVSRVGGRFNAFTWIDFTAYFETMPSDEIDLALRLESDRMVNAFMDETSVDSERTVILSERHMYENQPMFLLHEELQAAAFRVHPYHHEVIGDEVDLQTMTRQELYGHYRRYYAPANAVVVVVGDFEPDDMLVRIEEQFGAIAPGEVAAPVARQEPRQKGERRVTVHGPGDTAYLVHAYRAPAATDEDFYPLVLLNAAFAGGSSLGFFAGAGSNKSSRLYKALVSSGLAVHASGSMTPTIDPFLYRLSVVAQSGRSLEEIEAALDATVQSLEQEPITQAELDRALKRAKAQFVMAGESVTGQGQMIGMSEIVAGDYHWFEETLEQLHAVTLPDVERVRRRYLRPSQRTVGWYLPATYGQ